MKVHIESVEESINRIKEFIRGMEKRADILEGKIPEIKAAIRIEHPDQAKQMVRTLRNQIQVWNEQLENYRRFSTQ